MITVLNFLDSQHFSTGLHVSVPTGAMVRVVRQYLVFPSPRLCSCETSQLIPTCQVLRRNTFAFTRLQCTVDFSCVAWLLVEVHVDCGATGCWYSRVKFFKEVNS